MLVIFPFEVPIYERAGIPVEFVGHPLVDLLAPGEPRAPWLGRQGLDETKPVVGLLPGSRPNESRRLLPILLEAIPLIRQSVPGAQFVSARAPALADGLFAGASAWPGVVTVTEATDQALAAADVVVTASGTATVQTALHDRPRVIVYRVSGIDAIIGRAILRVSTFGMVNLIAGRPVVPELIQEACTAANIAREAVSLLTDGRRAAAMRRDLEAVRTALGASGASMRAAAAVERVVANRAAGVKY
jgi:lipid-A-disaccharide synthase